MNHCIANICENEYEFFLNHSNVVGVGLGEKITNGMCTSTECITVFVTKKLPKDKLSPNDIIPEQYNCIDTDIIEVGEIKALALTAKIRPMQFGYSIGPASLNLAGTAGCLVRDKSSYYILSNNHVLAGENTLAIGTSILQPGKLDGGIFPRDSIASLSSFIPILFKTATTTPTNYVDCAIAKVNNISQVSPSIALIGPVKGQTTSYLNQPVKKVGRTSGLTTSVVKSTNSTVSVQYSGGKTAVFKNQIVTSYMSSAGDSGSLIVDNNNKAVALLFAGSPSVTIGCPIATVLSSLKVTLVTQ